MDIFTCENSPKRLHGEAMESAGLGLVLKREAYLTETRKTVYG